MPEACSKQDKRRNDVRTENDDRHYSHSISTAAPSLSGELPSDYSSRNIDFSNKHAPLYSSNDHEFPESVHELNPTTDRTWNGDTGTGSRTLQKDFVAFPLVKPPSDYSSRNIDLANKHTPLYTSNDHEFPESVHERNPTTDRTLNGTGA